MKKIYTLIAAMVILGTFASNAQNIRMFQTFKFNSFFTDTLISDGSLPPGSTTDYHWYTFSLDGLADASTGGTRPDEWFAVLPFSDVDLYDGAGDTNVVMTANSWLSGSAIADKWIITQSIQLGATDTLYWKSAPFQTPRYLDGYKVRISTTTNDDTSFGPAIFTAKEMTALGSDTTFSTFTFGPSGAGFVHGQDHTYIDFATTTAPYLHRGQLRPFYYALSAYANQKIYVAFQQYSTDDNLISIDDIMVRGPGSVGINENKMDLGLNLFPNPATDRVQVNYELSAETTVSIRLFDVTGKLVSVETKGAQPQGRHFAFINTSELAKGFYTVSIQTENGTSTAKLIVK
jgi:hypothetical protein